MGWYNKRLAKSLWVFHISGSPCNNCDIEILDLITPKYDVERLGIKLVGSIRHADVLLITGVFNKKVAPKIRKIYEQAPKPIFVVAIGSCPSSGICFKDSYNIVSSREDVIPINMYIPGCPPKPEAMIEGVAKLMEILNG
ncbi:MAG: NADH-quinone oxidoreductase subunit NuoB [Candidatus Marinimicrobia bacterium]|jgi:Ni,Fe-hydrogenase III small subunit|nr:NADH-quinone oxidoreductase subunit NuoB [Candidatus Neomarinimicrobiota bacterium]